MNSKTFTDPICGMKVEPATAAAVVERAGEKVYFCSTHCRDKFVAGHADGETHEHACCSGEDRASAAPKPAGKYFCPMCAGVESDQPGSCPKCGMALERNPTFRQPGKTIYTCPMHPQIEQDHPGNCPICGMTLEPKNVAAGGDDENHELRDMTRRFWIGAVLTLPVFVLGMSHALPHPPEWMMGAGSRWTQFVLSTPLGLLVGLAVPRARRAVAALAVRP